MPVVHCRLIFDVFDEVYFYQCPNEMSVVAMLIFKSTCLQVCCLYVLHEDCILFMILKVVFL